LAFQSAKLSDPRQPAVLAAAGLAFFAILMMVASGKLMLFVTGIGLLFFFGLIVPLTDSAVLRADRRGELVYAPVRAVGTVSFVVANLLGGAIISATSDRMAVVWMAATGILTLIFALRIPLEPAEAKPRPRPDVRKALILFRSKSFLYMLFASGCVQGSHAVYYAFSELAFSAEGYAPWLIGMLWTVGTVAEILFLMRGKKLMDRLGPTGLLIFGAAGAVWRWPLMGMGLPLVLLVPVQMLHTATFGMTYMGTVEFIGRAVPEEYRVTAMTIVSSLGVGAVTGVATLGAGYIFVPESPFPAYAAMGGLASIGLGLALLLRRRWDGGTLGAVKDA
ncbi:MAG: MFS transporter, partial [Pseudomonadota bacterium]